MARADRGEAVSTNQPEWTNEQLKAIRTVGRDVYVTASAGTGKTAVLSGRCAELIGAENACANISEMVVLTFTEAAAEEMTARIGKILRITYLQNRDRRLKEQLLRLDTAKISTIHSFCQSLIREHFFELGIDPMFGIIDGDEQKLIKSRVLKEVADEAFADETIAQGISELLYGRDLSAGIRGFLDEVINIYDFLESCPDRDNWYNAAKIHAEEGINGEFAQKQKNLILEKLKVCRQQLELTERMDDKLTKGNWYQQLRTEMMPAIEELIEKVSSGAKGWKEAVGGFKKPKFKNKPKGTDDEIVKAVKGPAIKAFETIENLKSLAIVNPRYEQVVAGACAGQTRVIIELVKRFERKYRKAKETIGCMDFADLEHYTLKLLCENKDVADRLKRKYRFVFVDEFQDINRMQERIIAAISRGDNMFLVGDVKQSIYAFRHSDPSLFIEKLNAADTDDNSKRPMRVDLSENFRSRAGVLEFTNTIFERIMNERIGGIEYDKRAELKAGFEYEKTEGPAVRINIIDETATDVDEEKKKGSDPFNFSTAQKQAAMIVSQIRRLVADKVKVYDKQTDKYRTVGYGDIVVLMRSPAAAAREYVELFRKAKIPVNSESAAGYFAATEIADMIGLLKVLDNPQRDVELAAVMRSPMFNFSDTELALIRGHGESKDPKMNFYRCAAEYSQDGADEKLRGKIGRMLSVLDGWRSMGRRGRLADLIWKVYRRTGYLAFAGGITNGSQRRANLLKLHDRAIQFEGFAGNESASLGKFVEFAEELLEGEHDWAPAQPEGTNEEAVRIMSIHKSKGLEFPIVFLAQTNSRFNMQDSRRQCMADRSGGLGMKVIDKDTGYGFRTITQEVIAEEKKAETTAEEMRVLYVALTRARERLYVCASMKKNRCADVPGGCGKEKPMDFQIMSASCMFDWILNGLGGFEEFVKLFENDETSVSNGLFEAEIHDSSEMEKLAREILYGKQPTTLPSSCAAAVDDMSAGGCRPEDILKQVKEAIAWEYDYKEDTARQAKASVTELTHKDDEFAQVDYGQSLNRVPEIISTEKTSDTLAAGTATHLLMNKCINGKCYSKEKIEKTRQQLAEAGLISDTAADKINIKGIAGFFESELGKLLQNNTVYSEWPFTVDDDGVIVQGIIDCIIETDEGLYVIDFKTDKNTEKRKEKYTRQINYYANAAEKILGKKVIGKFICYLNINETIQV